MRTPYTARNIRMLTDSSSVKSHGTGPYIAVPFINRTRPTKKHEQHVGLFSNVFQPFIIIIIIIIIIILIFLYPR